MARPIPVSLHPDLTDKSFSQRVPVVEEDESRSGVVARRRIGEHIELSRPPFVDHVPVVDMDQDEHRSKVVQLNLTPSASTASVSRPAQKPASPSPAAHVTARPGWVSKLVNKTIHALPAPMARHALWFRNLFLGATLSFADASLSALSPVAFLWKNLPVVSLGLLYLSLPLVPSLALLYHVEPLGRAYAPNTLVGGLYLVGLYVSTAVVMMGLALASGFFWRGAVRLMNHFARTGAQAFPTR